MLTTGGAARNPVSGSFVETLPADLLGERRSRTVTFTIVWRAGAVLALLTAGCGREEDREAASELPADELYNRIEAAREADTPAEAPPARLAPLRLTDIPAELRDRPSCRLARDGRVLLLATTAGAVARLDDRPLRMRIAGLLDSTGGFFEAEGATISVGRQVAPLARGAEPAGLATASIGNRRDAAVGRVEGTWQCAAGIAVERTEKDPTRSGSGT